MEIRRIGVIHLNQIGDLIFSLILLRALREKYPQADIHSILRPHLKELLVGSPYVDRLIERKEGVTEIFSLSRKMRRNHYDLLITLSSSIECLLLATLSGSRIKAGFSHFPWDIGLHVKEKIEGHHSWYNNMKLLRRLDIEVRKKDYVGLLVLPEEKGRPRVLDSPGRYAVISPGTSVRRRIKAWEEEKFARLAALLWESYRLSPVFVGGKADVECIDRIIRFFGERCQGNPGDGAINLAGKIGLKQLCYVIRDATIFVGVDSGIMHIASSLGVPVVGIFGPSDPFYVGPQNAKSLVVREALDCVPCYLRGCEHRACMVNLGVEKVFDACRQLLEG